LSDNTRPGLGIALILAAGLMLASQDALAKTLAATYPLLLLVCMRYLVQSLLMMLLFAPRMGLNLVRTRRPLLQLARGMSLVGITLFFYAGLRYIPLGEATAVIFLAPLVVVVISVLWLKEPVSRGVWLAVGGGLVGVLLVVRPGGALFTPASLLPLAAAFCFGFYQLLTRRLSETDAPATSNFLSALVGTVGTAVLLPWIWQMPAPTDLLLMGALGCLAMVGHMLLTHAYRFASAASLAPFTYGQILIATLIGMLVFGHVPDALALLGMAVIMLSGAALVWSQRPAAQNRK